MKILTKAVHIGRDIEQDTGAITPAISLSTTFVRKQDGTYRKGYQYIRSNNPNRERLEKAIASLEGQQQALAFSSGLAAFSSVLLTLKSNDRIVLPDDMYYGGRSVVDSLVKQFGIEAKYCNQQNEAEIEPAINERTKLIWIETPSNPYLKIVDIEKIVAQAKEVGALTAVDNTWATPMLQNPISLGADLVMHSTTKFIGGHSDVQGGILVPSDTNKDLFEKLRTIQKNFGAVPSPFDCWLLIRSIPTLPLRVKQQSETAMKLAQFLSDHPNVEQVLYPGLEDHVNHDVASRQMSNGYGGMISIITKNDEQYAKKIANSTKIFKQATSLGGIESLIEHRASVEGSDSKTSKNLLRLSIGIEDFEDLQDDLRQALKG